MLSRIDQKRVVEPPGIDPSLNEDGVAPQRGSSVGKL